MLGITSGGSLFFDVCSVGLLVMSVVGRVPNADRCRFATNVRDVMIILGVAAIGLRMWDDVGMVEPRNIRRPRHTAKPRRHFTSGLRRLQSRQVRYAFWPCLRRYSDNP